MPGMTRLLMPTTPLCLAFLEGDNVFIDNGNECMYTYYTHMYSTMKIVGISTISRGEHHVAQTRELECTKVVVPQVIARGGLQD